MNEYNEKYIGDLNHLTGPDVSLDISLFEYGIAYDDSAYQEDPVNYEVDFILGCEYIMNECDYPVYSLFYNGSMDIYDFQDLFHRDSWCNVQGIAKCSGLTIKQLYQGFPHTIHDFIMYYGYENFFSRPVYKSQYFRILEV